MLGLDLSRGEGQQLLDRDGVAGAVVDPAPAQDAVLGRSQERVVRVERGATVGHRHEVPIVSGVSDDHQLDADLARRVVEPESAGLLERRRPSAAIPGTAR